MMHQLEYQQTPRERYDTDMNERVETLVKSFGYPIAETYGGTGMGEADDLVAENGFVIEAGSLHAQKVATAIEKLINRSVAVTEVKDE